MITQHAEEIEKYINEYEVAPTPIVLLTTEKLLENFLVENWKHTELGRMYDVLEEDGEMVGQQYQTDTGPIDILAVSKDKTELLVVELKKGRASDSVVGQIQRYMGFVQKNVAGKDQLVKGVIIAADDDKRIRNALHVTKNIDFFRYHISLKLIKDSDA
jgi:restriction system protein